MSILSGFLWVVYFFNPIITGKVIDEETQTPIPYAYIQFLDDDGTYITTNAKGEFQFEAIGNRQKGRIYIRTLGYEEAIINFDVSESLWLEVKLQPKEIQLDELIVKDRKTKPKIIGEKNRPIVDVNRLLGKNKAIMFDLKNQIGELTKLHFSLSGKYGFPDSALIFNIYIFQRFKGKIMVAQSIELDKLQPALKESVLFQNGHEGWNVLDLEPFGLAIDNSWVLIHIIYPKDKNSYTNNHNISSEFDLEPNNYFGANINYYQAINTKGKLIPMIHFQDNNSGKLVVDVGFSQRISDRVPAVALEFDSFK